MSSMGPANFLGVTPGPDLFLTFECSLPQVLDLGEAELLKTCRCMDSSLVVPQRNVHSQFPCRNVRIKLTKLTKSAPSLIPRWSFPSTGRLLSVSL
jgi:hypothetical protein